MLVKVRNLGTVERSVPTPANTSVPVAPNEEADFIWPAVDERLFDAMRSCDFAVETILQMKDVRVADGVDTSGLVGVCDAIDGLLVGTQVCDDNGIHVPNSEKWVTSEDRQTLVDSYGKALDDLAKVTREEGVESIVSDLTAAKGAFESAQQPGLVPSDPEIDVSKAAASLGNADLELGRTTVSEDGDGADSEGNGWWAKQSDFDTLSAAKRAAVRAVSEASDQGAVDSAVETLDAAIGAFKSARQVVKLAKVTAPAPEDPVGSLKVSDLQEVEVSGTEVTGTVHRVTDLVVGKSTLAGNYLFLDVPKVDESKVRLATTLRNSKMVLATVGGLDHGVLISLPKNIEGLNLTVKQTNVGEKTAVDTATYDLSKLSKDPIPE